MTKALLMIWCTIAAGGAPPKRIDLKSAEQLAPGRTTKAEIRKLFGKPLEVVDFKHVPAARGRKDLGELWTYGIGDDEALSVFFPPGSAVLETWIWHVPEGDPAQKLKTALGHFESRSWEVSTVKWINPHSYPNECFFEDKKAGISIEYNRARKEVVAISRRDPSRTVASEDKDEKPPQFCIDNACSPGISPAEFFKEIPLSKYCELPK